MEVRSVEAIVSALNKAEAKYLIVGGLAVKTLEPIKADWKWGSPEGSRELDRLLDRQLTFCEKLEWLEEAETLSLRLRARRAVATAEAGESRIAIE